MQFLERCSNSREYLIKKTDSKSNSPMKKDFKDFENTHSPFKRNRSTSSNLNFEMPLSSTVRKVSDDQSPSAGLVNAQEIERIQQSMKKRLSKILGKDSNSPGSGRSFYARKLKNDYGLQGQGQSKKENGLKLKNFEEYNK